jgi:hypothetical protein
VAYDAEKNLTSHKPSDSVANSMEAVRAVAKDLANEIDGHCPDSREKSLAFTNLEQCVMWSMAALARNQ